MLLLMKAGLVSHCPTCGLSSSALLLLVTVVNHALSVYPDVFLEIFDSHHDNHIVLIILRLKRYRSEISSILGASRSDLTTQRFMRLFGLSSLMILIILPLQTYVFYTNIRNLLPLHPYSWKALHGSNFSSILKVQTDGNLKFDRWIPVALSFLIFGFFGLGQDAANMYHSFFNAVGLKSLSTSFSSQGATSPHGGKSGSWYGTLRSRSNSWLGMKRA